MTQLTTDQTRLQTEITDYPEKIHLLETEVNRLGEENKRLQEENNDFKNVNDSLNGVINKLEFNLAIMKQLLSTHKIINENMKKTKDTQDNKKMIEPLNIDFGEEYQNIFLKNIINDQKLLIIQTNNIIDDYIQFIYKLHNRIQNLINDINKMKSKKISFNRNYIHTFRKNVLKKIISKQKVFSSLQQENNYLQIRVRDQKLLIQQKNEIIDYLTKYIQRTQIKMENLRINKVYLIDRANL
ncbi:hypothetical protein [Candidatus Phytoplasma sacchari]|uniref:Uncharacterized protein n=1 Tax=Candidatus Phytoplasma sacchari TaxID=2609813 RepID=A0ABY7M0F7_9MOLU|nr:hypothetical protein O7R10_01210 [Candidatus Phytoplasma sacchari]